MATVPAPTGQSAESSSDSANNTVQAVDGPVTTVGAQTKEKGDGPPAAAPPRQLHGFRVSGHSQACLEIPSARGHQST